eukprot:TRINITY_DN2909_c0_g1_i1.p2 TRINITY_DN2909_c0_g1~~TRINITY_DN2909_c0_g1_i1.p2  ORF type:complete len:361 (-),score=73.81 TRINITY_DN2909_c0_g1_i1:35-1117(-)
MKIYVDMYEKMGNQIALQYGGSELAHTMKSYQSNSGIATQSRDILTTLKRFYSNSFTDADKQNSTNLFLGHFVPWREVLLKNSPHLWDLENDFHLHLKKEDNRLIGNEKWWEEPIANWNQRDTSEGKGEMVRTSSLVKKDRQRPIREVRNDIYFDEFYHRYKFSFLEMIFVPSICSIITSKSETNEEDAEMNYFRNHLGLGFLRIPVLAMKRVFGKTNMKGDQEKKNRYLQDEVRSGYSSTTNLENYYTGHLPTVASNDLQVYKKFVHCHPPLTSHKKSQVSNVAVQSQSFYQQQHEMFQIITHTNDSASSRRRVNGDLKNFYTKYVDKCTQSIFGPKVFHDDLKFYDSWFSGAPELPKK